MDKSEDILRTGSRRGAEKLKISIQRNLEQIIAILLKNFFKLTNNLGQLHQATPALRLLNKMLPSLTSNDQSRDGGGMGGYSKQQNALYEAVSQFNDFYRQMSEKLQKQRVMRSNSLDLETFKQASEILCEVQKYANPESFNESPSWLNQVIDCAKKSQNQRT